MSSTIQTATEIRPFHVNVPEEALADLRRRIVATQWPEKETVSDSSQGVPLASMQELARYWATEYDWHKVEAQLHALPQFMTEIDGLDIHFIHVKSRLDEDPERIRRESAARIGVRERPPVRDIELGLRVGARMHEPGLRVVRRGRPRRRVKEP